jgi:proline iminopeptidase
VPSRSLILGALALALAACSDRAPAPSADSPAVESGYVDVPGGRVWYRKIGSGPGVPLLALHGGPGGTGCRFELLTPLTDERPVIYYDQLGSGRSDRPTDTMLWQLNRFVDEVAAVRSALGLDSVHMLGHSWGGALLAEYMIAAKPAGVGAVILSSPLLSTPQWIADADSLRGTLPESVRALLDKHEAAGTLSDPEYLAATDSFYARYVTRGASTPVAQCDSASGNDVIYQQMWGPTEFRATGSLRDWDRSSDLPTITNPTLLMAGEFDEARPFTLEGYARTMPNARLEVIGGAAHSTLGVRPDEYVRLVRAFLNEVERQ